MVRKSVEHIRKSTINETSKGIQSTVKKKLKYEFYYKILVTIYNKLTKFHFNKFHYFTRI